MAMQQAATQESIVDHIKKDHKKTSEEIMELEKRVRGRRDDSLDPVFVPMKKELLGHMAAEEKLAVPAPRPGDAAADAGRSAGARGGPEAPRAPHGRGSMPEDEWARHLQMMKQGIEHHVQEEESKILPAAQRIVGDQRLRELGAEFKRMEEQYK